MLALRLPEDLEDRLDALAKKTGRTKSFYAREAIVEYIDDLEDLYLAQMRHALQAGRLSYQAGRISKKRYATASSPFEGVISYIPGE